MVKFEQWVVKAMREFITALQTNTPAVPTAPDATVKDEGISKEMLKLALYESSVDFETMVNYFVSLCPDTGIMLVDGKPINSFQVMEFDPKEMGACMYEYLANFILASAMDVLTMQSK